MTGISHSKYFIPSAIIYTVMYDPLLLREMVLHQYFDFLKKIYNNIAFVILIVPVLYSVSQVLFKREAFKQNQFNTTLLRLKFLVVECEFKME
jgi:hypothetical protein